MRFFWRGHSHALARHDEWLDEIDRKNRQPGTSAPTLATSWSGPLDLLGALSAQPALARLTVEQAVVEAKATFDTHGGNVRNHDLVLRGRTDTGDSVVVCVEAKAGERLGETVAEQRARAAKARATNPRSRATERLEELVGKFCRDPLEDPRVGSLRYQLLTAWAGTLADAAGTEHAVFALHEFRTDQRPADKTGENGAELARFADAVLGCELPRDVTWCVRVPDVPGIEATLYLAHVVTDLRSDRLIAPSAESARARTRTVGEPR